MLPSEKWEDDAKVALKEGDAIEAIACAILCIANVIREEGLFVEASGAEDEDDEDEREDVS